MSSYEELTALLRESAAQTVALAQRTVRTAEGQARYGEPIGAVIEVDENGNKIDSKAADDQSTEAESGEGGDQVSTDTQNKLLTALVSRGAQPQLAKQAVEKLPEESKAQSFIEKLQELDIASKQKVDRDPNNRTGEETQLLEEAKEVRIVQWRGQDIEVPKGARIGQVPPTGDFPALFYWYDSTTGEVHGRQSDGKLLPPMKVPAGASLKTFFDELKKAGGPSAPLQNNKLMERYQFNDQGR